VSLQTELIGSLVLLDRCERAMQEAHALLLSSEVHMTRRVALLREATALVADAVVAGRNFTERVTPSQI
jgi:hypothetical protein